jgi:bifunctional UDP-N-acetylglucosamine pyrophosphorylase/glucosamine-1-phosphate N-acetyltransferase
MSMQAVILAAGKGTRLAPITSTRSKGMLPVLGKPITERIIRGMLSSGLRDFILVVNPDDHEIKEYFQSIFSPDIQIQFVEQDQQLGAAHALGLAAPHISGDFVLSACDNLVPESEMDLLVSGWSQLPDIKGLLTLERIQLQDADKTGIVTLDGDQVKGIIEKPHPSEAQSNISSTPLYVFSNLILDYLPNVPVSQRGEFELQDAIQMMINEDLVVNGIFLKKRLTLTNADDLLAINLEYLYAIPENKQVHTDKIGSNTKLVPPLLIEGDVEIGSDCQIGPGVFMEKNVHIGDNVQLENAVLLRDTILPNNTVLRSNVIY